MSKWVKLGGWEEFVDVPPTVTIQRRHHPGDDEPAAMLLGKTIPSRFGPKDQAPPQFNPDSDLSPDSKRKDKPKVSDTPDSSDDNGNSDDDNKSTEIPTATEQGLPDPQTSTTDVDPLTVPPAEATTSATEYMETWPPSEGTTTSSSPRQTPPLDTQLAEAHETTTTAQLETLTTTDSTGSTMTPCTTTYCSTNTLYPSKTICYETTIPFVIEENISHTNNILADPRKLVAVILLTMVVTVFMTVGCIWGYKRRQRMRIGIEGVERKGGNGDVEGGPSKRRKFWGILGKGKEREATEKANAATVGNNPAAVQAEVPVLPEVTQRTQRLSIILPPGSSHHHRLSNNTVLGRTLSTASSLTVPPYPGHPTASSTTRSNSTRTARSIASNITDDTVVRTKREYQSRVNRLAEENMHSDHAVVADGFHLAPPDPFNDDGSRIAGAGGMGGSGIGIGGLGEVDGEGNRRVVARPPPPMIRVGDEMDPFADPDIDSDVDMGVADGFSWNGGRGMMQGGLGIIHPPQPPSGHENPFEDGMGAYPEVDAGMGDGFSGYVPGQMGRIGGGNASPQRRVSMRGGDARRRVSGDRLSIVSSTSGESLSSNETLRGDLEDWSGGSTSSGGGGSGHHVGDGHGGRR